MSAILKIKDQNGNVIGIPAIVVGGEIGELTAKLKLITSQNLYQYDNSTAGYITIDGTVTSSATLRYFYLDVTEGDRYDALYWTGNTNKYVYAQFRFVTAYNSAGDVASNYGAQQVSEYVVPPGITKIAITVNPTTYPGIYIAKSDYKVVDGVTYNYTPVPYDRTDDFTSYYAADTDFVKRALIHSPNSYTIKGSLTADEKIQFPTEHVSKNYTVSFKGSYVAPSATNQGFFMLGRFGAGGTWYSDYFVLTPEHFVHARSTTVVNSYTHGLSFTDVFGVEQIQHPADASDTTLIRQVAFKIWGSNGSYTTPWISLNYDALGTYTLWSLTGCDSFTASMSFNDGNKPVYIFGDSYLSYRDDRLGGQLIQNGCTDNCLISAYAGAASTDMLKSFQSIVSVSSPKYVVWAMGMNDQNAYASWQTGIMNVLAWCEENGAIPILCTIPSVPGRNHEQKNTWIRNSPYRYIDFAAAVGATSEGTWYEGMLSDDNVHPTEYGAQQLFLQMATDFPEITVSNSADGKDGADGKGMDITGATIGQIAKITAVDEEGNPTAWEPVDLPKGEETWDLIQDITTAEDVGSVSFTDLQDYSKLCLEFKFNIDSASQVFLNVNGATASDYAIGNITYANAGYRSMLVSIFTDPCIGVTRTVGSVTSQTSAKDNITWAENNVTRTVLHDRYTIHTGAQFPISTLKIWTNVGNIVSGGKLRLWGVKT